MCVFHKDGKILVAKGFEKAKNETFYRLLGGSLNEGEKSEDGIRREMHEELQSDLENLRLLDVVENTFVFEGVEGHQKVFIYSADLARKELYSKNPIHIVEETYEFDAGWVSKSELLAGKTPLYPAFDYSNLFQKL